MLYRKFSTWADTDTLRCLYLTCIRPHLEYACQLWDPYTTEGIHSLESVQKFACKVCLKQWNMDYDSMLKLLGIPLLATRRKYLKLTTMYNIVHNSFFFFLLPFLYSIIFHTVVTILIVISLDLLPALSICIHPSSLV